ncbi:MAG TPA: hypothetical protein VN617_02155 [Rhodoferax sp.]|nr:hypothetical protein [Rhodoferax sp.]
MNFRNLAAGGFLLFVALSGHALTVGAVHGDAVVGQPLDVSVPVTLDTGDDASSLCVDGDVLYGNTRLDPNRVSMTPKASPSTGQVMVRIRSTIPVDEPVVTMNLHAGCAAAVTRRYVLLADAPTDIVAAAPLVSAGPNRSVVGNGEIRSDSNPNPNPNPSLPSAGSGATRTAQRATPGSRRFARPHRVHPARRHVAKATASRHAAVPPVRPAAEAPTASKAHLQLDPVELSATNPSDLKVSSALQAPPVANDPKRAEAAAVWRTLSAQPQNALQDALRMQALETEMNSLRAQSLKNQASLLALTAQLQRASDRRFSNTIVYVLVALLAAAIGLAMYLALQMRRGSRPARRRSWPAHEDGAADPENGALGPMGATIVSPLSEQFPQAPPRSDGRFGPAPLAPASPDPSAAAHAKRPRSGPPVQPTDLSTTRAVNAEELFDIQQQADFFVSLGQHEQAIELLKQHIDENAATSPLAYLDLLAIYHRLDLKDDYARLRGDFTRAFNVQVPPFEAFTGTSKGLEAYPAALARIEALWPSIKVLDAIEASIFRRPGADDGEEGAFDPEAYRELLLLFSIAREVTSFPGVPKRVEADPSDWMAPDTMPPITPPPPSPRLGLDVDLNDPSGL